MHFSKNNCAQQHKKYTELSKIKVMATPAINGGRGVRRQRGVGVGDPFNLSNLTTGANVSKRQFFPYSTPLEPEQSPKRQIAQIFLRTLLLRAENAFNGKRKARIKKIQKASSRVALKTYLYFL